MAGRIFDRRSSEWIFDTSAWQKAGKLIVPIFSLMGERIRLVIMENVNHVGVLQNAKQHQQAEQIGVLRTTGKDGVFFCALANGSRQSGLNLRPLVVFNIRLVEDFKK